MSRILLAGDSTVTEQPRSIPYDPARCYCGWGQMLHRFLLPETEVLNFAVSGMTVETFRSSGQYDALFGALWPGDVVLFQFGHNDQKVPHLQAKGAYRAALMDFVYAVREAGGFPALVTPVARNSWYGDGSGYNDLLLPYAHASLHAGEASGAPVLNLHALSMAWVRTLGLQKAKAYFYPGDYTHANDYGGYHWARLVATACADAEHPGLLALRGMLLPKAEWAWWDVSADAADPVYGWLLPPARRSAFDFVPGGALLSARSALEMAMQGYGYFAVNGGPDEALPPALRAAIQHRYLPQAFPQDGLDEPVSALRFRQLMLFACAGRNHLPQVALSLVPAMQDDDTVTGQNAVYYALTLEAAATGARQEQDAPQDGPAGS